MKKILGLIVVSIVLLAGCGKLLPHRSDTESATSETTKVFKGKIDGNEFTINFVFYFVDIILMFLSTLVSAKIFF